MVEMYVCVYQLYKCDDVLLNTTNAYVSKMTFLNLNTLLNGALI